MSLINGLTGIAKGTPQPVTLDKAVLFALPSVQADGYWGVEANIAYAKIIYKSTIGGQKKSLTFDITQATPSAMLSFSLKARDVFAVQKIMLIDFDGGYFTAATADIPGDIGINFTPAPPVGAPMTLTVDASIEQTIGIQALSGGTITAIDWGDGTINTNYTHTYADALTHTISIYGTATTFGGFNLGNNAITACTSWGDLGLTALYQAFNNCANLTQVPTILPAGVYDVAQMFRNCTSFDQDISGWDVSTVINMSQMFDGATIFNQSLNTWDVSSVQNMSFMFAGATLFNGNITSWVVSNVNDMMALFKNTSFNQNISAWNVLNVTNMSGMFENNSAFNQDIGAWNVSAVTNMDYMFSNATLFNQNLSGWCVTNIIVEPAAFATGSALTEPNKPVWGTCPV